MVFFIFIFFLFLPLNKKINLKRVKSISKSRDVTSLEEEFMFQPEIEKNSQEQGSIRLGPRTRRGGTSSSTSCREVSRFSYRSPSFTTTREPRERKRLPQPMRMTPLRVYVLRAYNLLPVFIQKNTQLRCPIRLHVSANKLWALSMIILYKFWDHFKGSWGKCLDGTGWQVVDALIPAKDLLWWIRELFNA